MKDGADEQAWVVGASVADDSITVGEAPNERALVPVGGAD
jgi:hypothetical protein